MNLAGGVSHLVHGSIRFLYRFTWVYFLDKTEGATDRSGQKLRLVAGARNHPNVPSIPFSFELHPNHLKRTT